MKEFAKKLVMSVGDSEMASKLLIYIEDKLSPKLLPGQKKGDSDGDDLEEGLSENQKAGWKMIMVVSSDSDDGFLTGRKSLDKWNLRRTSSKMARAKDSRGGESRAKLDEMSDLTRHDPRDPEED